MWIGGLAEKQNLFGGVLGSTFEYIFRTQMEALQDADRMYYLPRIEGMDYEDSLQDSSLAQLIRANTDIKHLPGNIFRTPEYTIEAKDYYVKDPVTGNVVFDATTTRLYPEYQRHVRYDQLDAQPADRPTGGSHRPRRDLAVCRR